MMYYITKRDGRKVKYNRKKIENAMEKAFIDVDGEIDEYGYNKIKSITDYIESKIKNENEQLSVEQIQDLVVNGLMNTKRKDVATSYVIFREDRNRIRQGKSNLIIKAGEKLMGTNIENQNANVDELSFGGRIGEASSVLNVEYALEYIISEKARYNHKHNRIYIHDFNSYAVGMHNCFQRDTRFITNYGVKSFEDFSDGSQIKVLSMDGEWHDATVHYYGRQKMKHVTFERCGKIKEVNCTANHRWILDNGEITENLSVGDMLLSIKDSSSWKVIEIKNQPNTDYEAWCVEEPITHSFMLEDDMLTGNCLSIPFDNALKTGVNTRQVDLRSPKSVSAEFQLIAVYMQLQSLQQFGGVSATHIDHTSVPYVRMSFMKHYISEYLKSTGEFYELDILNMDIEDFDEWIDNNKSKYLKELGLSQDDFYFDNKDNLDPKFYQAALFETRKETYQAVEALYHNLNSLQSRSGRMIAQ